MSGRGRGGVKIGGAIGREKRGSKQRNTSVTAKGPEGQAAKYFMCTICEAAVDDDDSYVQCHDCRQFCH